MPRRVCPEHAPAEVTWIDDFRGTCPVCEQLAEVEAQKKVIFSNDKFRGLVDHHLADISGGLEDARTAVLLLSRAMEELEDKAPPRRRGR